MVFELLLVCHRGTETQRAVQLRFFHHEGHEDHEGVYYQTLSFLRGLRG